MPVRYFHKERKLPLQTECINDIREFPSEFFGEQDDPYVFIRQYVFQRLAQLLTFMDDHAVHTGKAHACIGVYVIADEIHFHIELPPFLYGGMSGCIR